jgi:hypothetical protein
MKGWSAERVYDMFTAMAFSGVKVKPTLPDPEDPFTRWVAELGYREGEWLRMNSAH